MLHARTAKEELTSSSEFLFQPPIDFGKQEMSLILQGPRQVGANIGMAAPAGQTIAQKRPQLASWLPKKKQTAPRTRTPTQPAAQCYTPVEGDSSIDSISGHMMDDWEVAGGACIYKQTSAGGHGFVGPAFWGRVHRGETVTGELRTLHTPRYATRAIFSAKTPLNSMVIPSVAPRAFVNDRTFGKSSVPGKLPVKQCSESGRGRGYWPFLPSVRSTLVLSTTKAKACLLVMLSVMLLFKRGRRHALGFV